MILNKLVLAALFPAFYWLCLILDCLFKPSLPPQKEVVPDGIKPLVPGANSGPPALPEKKAAEFKVAEEKDVCTAFIDCNGI